MSELDPTWFPMDWWTVLRGADPEGFYRGRPHDPRNDETIDDNETKDYSIHTGDC